MCRVLVAALAVSLGWGCPEQRAIRFSDVPIEHREWLAAQGLEERTFADAVLSLEQRTVEREREGERDHLIYFILQSNRFTREPRIEPAESARDFAQGMPLAERERFLADPRYNPPVQWLPASAARRILDFTRSPVRKDERIGYLQALLRKEVPKGTNPFDFCFAQYSRVMRFLYRKEFSGFDKDGLAELYQERGYSTDTQLEANFAVHEALGVLAAIEPGMHCQRILVIGPGLDFAPRTDLVDDFPPQSYQPYALADALLEFKLARRDRLQIQCIDINPRVVAFLNGFSRQPMRRLFLFSGIAARKDRPFHHEFRDYFERLGRRIGTSEPFVTVPPALAQRLGKRLVVSDDIARRVRADVLNIVTRRYDTSPRYDLVVATNVLAYFNPVELMLALVNIEAAMKPGGYFVHNEARVEALSQAEGAGLRLVQARTALIAGCTEAPLQDTVWLHRKAPGTRRKD